MEVERGRCEVENGEGLGFERRKTVAEEREMGDQWRELEVSFLSTKIGRK